MSYSCPVVTTISIISIILSSNKIQDENILAHIGCHGKWPLNEGCRCRLSYGLPCPPVVRLSVCLSVCPTVPFHKSGTQARSSSKFGENKSPCACN